MAWVSAVGAVGHDGDVPGLAGSRLVLSKGEAGLDGALSLVDGSSTRFVSASALRVSATVACAFGLDAPSNEAATIKVDRLGKSIDLLVSRGVYGAALRKVSEEMEKVSLTSDTVAQNMMPTPIERHQPVIESRQLGGGLWHHVARSGSPVTPDMRHHTISRSSDPHDRHSVVGSLLGDNYDPGFADPGRHPFRDGKPVFQVGVTAVSPEVRGTGIGTLLYHSALQHHGRMVSDTHVSEAATKAWSRLHGISGVRGGLGQTKDDLHWASVDPVGPGVQKIELPGQSAKPVKQGEPIGAEPPSRATKKQTATERPPPLRMSEKSSPTCRSCGGTWNVKKGQVKGCVCWSELIKTVTSDDGRTLTFGDGWDVDARSALAADLGVGGAT